MEEPLYIRMIYTSSIIRGLIINQMTMLERTIDYFLAKHFCKETLKAEELMNVIFATKYMTFENKRMIFDYITSLELYKKYKELNLSGIHARLDEFNKIRNEMAHYVIEYTDETKQRFSETQEITFLKFEKSISKVNYTVESAIEMAGKIGKFVDPVAKLISD